MVKIGSEGVLVLIFESINVECFGFMFLEKLVGRYVEEVFCKVKRKVIIFIFVLNVNCV